MDSSDIRLHILIYGGIFVFFSFFISFFAIGNGIFFGISIGLFLLSLLLSFIIPKIMEHNEDKKRRESKALLQAEKDHNAKIISELERIKKEVAESLSINLIGLERGISREKKQIKQLNEQIYVVGVK